nr:hypothetical protein Iba_chr02aCG11430 [Ipomoea batatas]
MSESSLPLFAWVSEEFACVSGKSEECMTLSKPSLFPVMQASSSGLPPLPGATSSFTTKLRWSFGCFIDSSARFTVHGRFILSSSFNLEILLASPPLVTHGILSSYSSNALGASRVGAVPSDFPHASPFPFLLEGETSLAEKCMALLPQISPDDSSTFSSIVE